MRIYPVYGEHVYVTVDENGGTALYPDAESERIDPYLLRIAAIPIAIAFAEFLFVFLTAVN